MGTYRYLGILLMSALLLTFYSAVSLQATPTWTVQTVDVNGEGLDSGWCPIAVDANNTAHIAYTDAYISHPEVYNNFHTPLVMYANWNGSGWNNQTIGVGSAYSLVLDANSTPHVLYGGLGGLMYATWTGSNWTSQTVDTNGTGFGSVALDSSGNPHVAYTDSKVVKYASWTGINWEIQTVDSYSEIPLQLSLALDSNNTPYILYGITIFVPDNATNNMGWNTESLKLATRSNSMWGVQTVATGLNSFGNMVLDSKGYPHFICRRFYPELTGGDNSTLEYARWDGTAWKTQAVFSNASFVSIGFLALDSYDYPHIAFITSAGQPLTYASSTGKAWDAQTVDPNISPIGPCYLAVDSDGTPHISYRGLSPVASSLDYIMYATEPANSAESTSSVLKITPETLHIISDIALVLVIIVSLLLYRRHRKNKSNFEGKHSAISFL